MVGGVRADALLLEDANDLMDMAEAMKQVPPRRLWVEEFRNEDQAAELDHLFR